MCIYFFEWNKTNPVHAHWILMHLTPEARRAECIGQASNSGKWFGFVLSLLISPQKVNLIHTRQKNRIICSCLWKIINKKHKNLKNINNFTQWKNGSVDVTFTRAITHQKHLKQSGRTTRSAVDISIHSAYLLQSQSREHKIKLECMNESLDLLLFSKGLYINRLTAHNWQKWKKEYSSHVPTMKFIG